MYPYLFTLYPLLFVFGQNSERVGVRSAALTAVVALFFIHILLFSLHRLGVPRRKASAAVALITLSVFVYGQVANQLGERFGSVNHLMLLVIFSGLILGGIALIVRTRSNLANLGKILDRVAILLVLMATVQVASASWSLVSARRSVPTADVTSLEQPDERPDIYFVVLDRYAGAETLRSTFGYDNEPFLDELSDKGFFVADESRTNVAGTKYSLTSSLNLEIPRELLDGSATENDVYADLQDHRVGRNLSALGYHYVHIGPPWRGTGGNAHADENVIDPWEYPRLLYASSMAWPVGERFLELDRRRQAEHVRFQMDQLLQQARAPAGAPQFVFGHMLVPHPPMVFDARGRSLSKSEEERRGVRNGYIEQVRFVNAWLTRFVDEILSTSRGRKSIVILQSDEGAIQVAEQPRGFSWQHTDREAADPFLQIFNAIRLPDPSDRLYPSISPVNTFRVLFNEYFGTRLELLPDDSYAVLTEGRQLKARKLPAAND